MKRPVSHHSSKLTFIIFLTLVLLLFMRIVSSFLVAIIVGGLFAVTLRPLQNWLMSKKIGRKLASFLVFTILIVLVIVPAGFFIKSVMNQAIMVKEHLQAIDFSFSSLFATVSKWPLVNYFISNPTELEAQINRWIDEYSTAISAFAVAQVTHIPTILLQTIFILLSFFFFLLDGENFVDFVLDKIPLSEDIKKALISSFEESSKFAIWATLMASFSQSMVMFLAFILLGVPAAFLAAAATFLFAFIPLLGSFPVWGLAALYLYFKVGLSSAIIMIVFGVATGLIDNVVRAFVLKTSKESLHPLLGLVSILGGIEVFGFFGVIIGPIVAALLITMSKVWPDVWAS